MVAAWIRAETGVGPAIASGSHTCSGSCADLPTAPANRSNAIAVAAPFVSVAAGGAEDDLVVQRAELQTTISASPISIAVSPTRVVTNAFFAALAFAVLSNQKPISR